jgi:DNA polymerase I-like protein with 3'-5' exonuclease and polymerase domains
VPLEVKIEDLKANPDAGRQRAQYERFGFKTWLKEVEGAAIPTAPSPEPTTGLQKRKYRAIFTEDELKELLLKIEALDIVGFDTVCVGEEPMTARLVGVSFAFGDEAVYLPLEHDYPGAPPQVPLIKALDLLKPWLEREDCRKVGENVKFDTHVLANHGVRLAGCVHDTLLESYVLEVHEKHELGMLAQRYCGWTTLSYDEVTGKGAARIAFSAVEVTRAAQYAAEKTDCALALHGVLFEKIQNDEKLSFVYGRIETPVLPVLWRMERNGVLLDKAKLEAQSHEIGKEILALEQKAFDAAGQPFNLGSPKQIQEILFERQKLPVKKKTPSGQPSTDEDSLAELALDHPLPRLILEHRALSKLKSTYTDKLPKSINSATGRVHTTYSQTTAVTGRLSSNEPNLQNIPIRTPAGRRIRECFIAPPGAKIVSADYSQIELRIMAHLSADESLRRAFRDGEDVHRATAAEVFGLPLSQIDPDQRRVAKVINFGLIYGMSSFGVAQNLGIDRGTAQTYVDRYFARFPGAKRYMDETRRRAREFGYVETVFGRRLWLPELKSGAPVRRDQRADAGHRGRSHQARHDRGAGFPGEGEAQGDADHASARRAGARGSSFGTGNRKDQAAAANAVSGQARRAAGGRSRRRRQLGQGALERAEYLADDGAACTGGIRAHFPFFLAEHEVEPVERLLRHVLVEVGVLGLEQAESGRGLGKLSVLLSDPHLRRRRLHDGQETGMELRVRRAAEIFRARRRAAGKDALRVPRTHLLHRVEEQLARFRDGSLGGAVHGDDKIVNLICKTKASSEFLGTGERCGQRNPDLRIAEEAVGPAKRCDRGVAALLERPLEAGKRLALRDAVQLG